jgi:hypothetical protein
MKIAICGAHGVGKTTLAERIALELGYAMIYTKVKEIEFEHHPMPLFNVLGKQNKIKRHLASLAFQNFSESVFDRGFPDVYGYSDVFIGKTFSEFEAEERHYKIFHDHLKEVESLTDMFDFYIFVHPGIPFKPAKGRFDEETQEEVSDAILDIFDQCVPRHKSFIIPWEVTNLEERVSQCILAISEFKSDLYSSLSGKLHQTKTSPIQSSLI